MLPPFHRRVLFLAGCAVALCESRAAGASSAAAGAPSAPFRPAVRTAPFGPARARNPDEEGRPGGIRGALGSLPRARGAEVSPASETVGKTCVTTTYARLHD